MAPNIQRRQFATALAGSAALASAQAMPPAGKAPGRSHWAPTWIAPPEPLWSQDFALPLGMPQVLADATLRQFLRISLGGRRLRLVVSNAYGHSPLTVGEVHVAPADGGAGATARFQGARGVMVAAGATAVTDPVALPIPDAARLRVDIHLPGTNHLAGFHWDAREVSLLLPGNAAGMADPGAGGTLTGQAITARAFLSAVLVESQRPAVTVVALGDSITDGNGSTPGADHRWPDFLAQRLQPQGVAVLNAGISGNRLLRPGMGESALARLDRDVLQQPGVRAVVALLGTNDIGWPGAVFAPDEPLPALEQLTQGWRQLVAQAHLRGVRVVGATLPPFEDALHGTPYAGHYSPAKDALRVELNRWILGAGAFDAVVDFDRLLRDGARPSRLRADYDCGDHLHPNDAGYRAMAQAIDLGSLLGPSPGP